MERETEINGWEQGLEELARAVHRLTPGRICSFYHSAAEELARQKMEAVSNKQPQVATLLQGAELATRQLTHLFDGIERLPEPKKAHK